MSNGRVVIRRPLRRVAAGGVAGSNGCTEARAGNAAVAPSRKGRSNGTAKLAETAGGGCLRETLHLPASDILYYVRAAGKHSGFWLLDNRIKLRLSADDDNGINTPDSAPAYFCLHSYVRD